jgi:hypothetical protein
MVIFWVLGQLTGEYKNKTRKYEKFRIKIDPNGKGQ